VADEAGKTGDGKLVQTVAQVFPAPTSTLEEMQGSLQGAGGAVRSAAPPAPNPLMPTTQSPTKQSGTQAVTEENMEDKHSIALASDVTTNATTTDQQQLSIPIPTPPPQTTELEDSTMTIVKNSVTNPSQEQQQQKSELGCTSQSTEPVRKKMRID